MSHYASIPDLFPLHGGCACGHIRYTLAKAPLAAPACHCPLCQRESGSGFTINAVIETEHIVPAPSAAPVLPGTNTPLGPPQPSLSPLSTGIASSPSGDPSRDPSGESAGQTIGRGFVVLAAGTPRFEEHYRPDDVYRPEALERLRAVVGAGTSAGVPRDVAG
ncbi:Zinc-type alcohol dehydrogenase-like protein C2E1P3.01 [Verticillium dahliae VDG2]|nr:Zinc-type alcohol dehydrogenase-like protein C2E1P3.01 [Verticillium dahliae VDG2]